MRGSVKRRGDSWRARYRDDSGKEYQRTFTTKRDADGWLRDQLAAQSNGTWVDPTLGHVSFADYGAQWLAQQHVRRSSHELMERRLRLQISPTLGELALSRIRRSHVVEMITRCADEGLSPSVVRHALSMVRAVLDAAAADRLVPVNVARDRSISVPRTERAPAEVLSAEQVAAIADNVEPQLRALVVLGAASGLRPGELFGLTADRISPPIHLLGDLSPRQAVVKVDRQAGPKDTLVAPKTASSARDVAIPASVVAVLVEHVRRFGLGEHGLLFRTASDRMITRGRASEIWSRATADLDLPTRSSWHQLRHFHASALLSQGISIAFVSRRLGHANAAITLNTYAHTLRSDEDRVLNAAEEIAREIV